MMGFKSSLKTNIPGWTGKSLAHMQGWFGEGNPVKVHRINRYLSNDPVVVSNQLDIIQSVGFDGVTVDWQGALVNPFLHEATMAICAACNQKHMLFCLMLDQWIAKQQPNPTQAVIVQLQSSDFKTMTSSYAYLPEKYIIEFDLANSAGVNIAAIQAAVPTFPILSWHTGFSWPNLSPNPQSPVVTIAGLAADNAKPTMKIAGVNIMFNDGGMPLPVNVDAAQFLGIRDYTTSAWGTSVGPTRVIDHQAGNYFYDQLVNIPKTMPYIALATWNDHDEGTGVEHIISAFSGTRLGYPVPVTNITVAELEELYKKSNK
jgi:hypothetical protein